MNELSTAIMTDPYGKSAECIKFTIDDISDTFILNDIAAIGQQYTIGLWLMSDSSTNISIVGKTFIANNVWKRYSATFTADSADLSIKFDTTGTYYLYHPKLEIGNKATDWTPAVEDVDEDILGAQSSADEASRRVAAAESLIQQLSDQILMVVSDENGQSMLQQTSTGWSFSLGGLQNAVADAQNGLADLQNEVGDTNHTVEILQQAVDDLGQTAEYIHIQVYEDEPCIELGESDSDFKLLITNTRIMFMDGSNVPTYIDTDGLNTENIVINKELRHTWIKDAEPKGHYIWAVRANGNYGLQWKGVTS